MNNIKEIPDPLIFSNSKNVYRPSDDSYLIIDYLKANIGPSHFDGMEFDSVKYVLDMGTGTGIIAIFLLLTKKYYPHFKPKIYASDILEEAIYCAKLNEKLNNFRDEIIYLQSDLFKSFPQNLKRKFNIIIFNPPYLPSIESMSTPSDISWNGGVRGIDILETFLDEVIEFIEMNNMKNYIYFISSSTVDTKELNKVCRERGFIHKILRKTHIFFEDIILNRLEVKNSLRF